MSISDNYQPTKSQGDGTTTIYTAPWPVFNEDYLQVIFEDVTTGVQTIQTSGFTAEFSSSLVTVTFSSAPASTVFVILARNIPLQQQTPYATSRGFQGRSIETSLDILTAITQDLSDDNERSIKFPVGSTIVSSELPAPIDGFGIVWDGTEGNMRNTTSSLAMLEGDAETVANNIASVNTVAADIDSVVTCSTNISSIIAAPTAASNAAASAAAADISETNSANSETNAAASAAAAASSAAEGLYREVVTKSFSDSPFVPSTSEEGYLFKVDTSGGDFVVNLSELSVYGEDIKFAFVKETAGSNTITINAGGSDTISGNSSITISTQYETHVLVGDSATGSWIDTVQSSGIADSSVTNAKLANVSNNTMKGRVSSGTGSPEDLTPTQGRAVLDVYSKSESDNLSGVVVQDVYGSTNSVSTSSSNIPRDDTIPQITEGGEVVTVSITPTSATNRLVIEARINVSSSNSSVAIVVALFKDSDADALSVGIADQSPPLITSVPLSYEMVAGTTSAITFRIRGGVSSGTVTFNGESGSRIYGGASICDIRVREIRV